MKFSSACLLILTKINFEFIFETMSSRWVADFDKSRLGTNLLHFYSELFPLSYIERDSFNCLFLFLGYLKIFSIATLSNEW